MGGGGGGGGKDKVPLTSIECPLERKPKMNYKIYFLLKSDVQYLELIDCYVQISEYCALRVTSINHYQGPLCFYQILRISL